MSDLPNRPHVTADPRGERSGAISDFDLRSTSPDGRYIVCIDPFEARAFQWVETPELFDTASVNEAEPGPLGHLGDTLERA